jgi:acyl-[acyl-carrier-protein]-phospholipid O-acyltransferase / long-chain-fatty-acid--[acyl-carrier-protein] ligase
MADGSLPRPPASARASFLLRPFLWLLAHSIYRLRTEGTRYIPAKGGALLVTNPVPMAGALLLAASARRPISFFTPKEDFDHPFLRPLARMLGVTAVTPEAGTSDSKGRFREAMQSLRAGEVVAVFTEAFTSGMGESGPLCRELGRLDAAGQGGESEDRFPVIPVHVDNVGTGLFGLEGDRFRWRMPRHIPCPVSVTYGRPMPPMAERSEIRQAIEDLHREVFERHRAWMPTISRAFLRTARRHPLRFAMADASSGALRFGSVLPKTVFLALRLRKVWEGQSTVGILLPPSVPGALVNQAAFLMGKVPVNLNYKLTDNLLSASRQQCGIGTIVTSGAFLERVKLHPPGRVVLLEELAAKPGWREILHALGIAWLCPARFVGRALGAAGNPSLDDLATIIFSSGTTGDPKGVMLTHFNIGSNLEQIEQVIALRKQERVLGILPFFHSFGFTVTVALPAALGVGVVFHPSPLDAGAIASVVREHRVTILLATPSFLQTYLRRCRPDDFKSLRMAIGGAEKLPEGLAAEFEGRFGIRLMEGYGCTECAPAVAFNHNDFRGSASPFASRAGKVGRILPGMSARVVDPETRSPLPPAEPGLLLVSGPNVMQGYLGLPEATREVLQDGWYTTGDIVTMDEDGFLEITDRLSRFSKIGGEMVPHTVVERKLHEMVGLTQQALAVSSVLDADHGERLVVLHTLAEEKLRECLQKLPQLDLPNLWKPRANQFFRVDPLPSTGIGKLDLRKLRELAVRLSASP